VQGFAYYLPGFTGPRVTRADVEAAGIGHSMAGVRGDPDSTATTNGPDGGPGCFAADGPVQPAGLSWRRIPGSTAWLGWDPHRPPGPAELIRRDAIQGHAVEFGDGRDWTVPIVRGYVEEDGEVRWYQAVPTISELDDAGKWRPGPVVARFAPAWRICEAWMEAISGAAREDQAAGEAVQFDFAGLHGAAVALLAVNYRLGPCEAASLGLLTRDVCIQVLRAACDMPGLEAIKKKLALATGNSDAG